MASPTDPTSPSAGQPAVAGRYALREVIGRGGAGTVWRGRDTLLDRPVAIKVFRADMAATADLDGSVDRDRILREARLAARLRHPGAVDVFDVVEVDGHLHLVMELVEAPDLATLVAREGPMDPAGAAALGLQLLDVLDAAHRLGVVHRDVKPANVLVDARGTARLTDFGTAILAGDDRMTATDVVLGSPAYMAPEQATTRDVSPAADLWALGATLYHAVEGRPPYAGPSAVATMHAVVHDDPRPPQRADGLAAVLDRLLVHDPEDRAGSAEVRDRLRAIADPAATDPAEGASTMVAPTTATTPPTAGEGAADDDVLRGGRRRTDRHRPVALVVVVIALLAAAGWLARSAVTGGEEPTTVAADPDPDVATEPLSGGSPATAPGQPDPSSADPGAPDDQAAEDATAEEVAGQGQDGPDQGGQGGRPGQDGQGRGQGQGQAQGQADQGQADQGQADQGQADQGQGQADQGQADQGQAPGDQAAQDGAAVPPDWVAFAPDHAPYRVSHPPEWTTQRLDRTRTDIRDPSSSAYLRLDWTDDPAPDPLADWQAYEPAFADGKDDYKRIRMESTTFDGQPAALWEYRYSEGGVTFHAYNLNVSGDGYGYALNYQTRESEWAAMEPLFAGLRASYDIVG